MAAENGETATETLRRRVQQRVTNNLHSELYKGTNQDPQFKSNRRQAQSSSPYSVTSILWIITAIATFYFTDFYVAILYDQAIKRTWFYIGVVLISINLTIGAFLIGWLSWIKKVPSDDWEQLYPAAIPIATGSFALGGLCVTIGLWPVWGIMTPVILFIQTMGVVTVIALFG